MMGGMYVAGRQIKWTWHGRQRGEKKIKHLRSFAVTPRSFSDVYGLHNFKSQVQLAASLLAHEVNHQASQPTHTATLLPINVSSIYLTATQ